MNSAIIIANILGGIIFILNIIGNAKLTTKKVFIYNALCNGLSVIQYLLLGAWTGIISLGVLLKKKESGTN
ncbi:MAG: YgjV family protein [Bacilli bacterium]|nr:YgjV family protein [Bacilli bacterium]